MISSPSSGIAVDCLDSSNYAPKPGNSLRSWREHYLVHDLNVKAVNIQQAPIDLSPVGIIVDAEFGSYDSSVTST